jgi:hypothetical protein
MTLALHRRPLRTLAAEHPLLFQALFFAAIPWPQATWDYLEIGGEIDLPKTHGVFVYCTTSVTATGSLFTPLLSIACANSVNVPLVVGVKEKVQTPLLLVP